MNISLSAETENFVRKEMQNGFYHDESELFECSLQVMIKMKEQLDEKIQQGLDDSKHGRVSSGKDVYDRLKNIINKHR